MHEIDGKHIGSCGRFAIPQRFPFHETLGKRVRRRFAAVMRKSKTLFKRPNARAGERAFLEINIDLRRDWLA